MLLPPDLFTEPAELRRHERVKRAFSANCSSDGGRSFSPAFPVDISKSGVGMIVYDTVAPDTNAPGLFLLSLWLEKKNLKVPARWISCTKGTLHGNLAWRVGAQFDGLDIEDEDAIERFTRFMPLGWSNRRLLDELQKRPHLTKELLPKEVLDMFVAELARLGRVPPLYPGFEPFVKLRYTGITHRDGADLHMVDVESHMIHEYYSLTYHTRFYFDEGLMTVRAVPLDNRTFSLREQQSAITSSLRPIGG